jgi:protein-L-isoaspartate(D-aspartate) O-methyltransferase
MAGDAQGSLSHRRALVQTLRRDGHLHSANVAAALLAVPREVFVPGVPLDEVYRPSDAIVTKRLEGISVSSCSAPEVIALMLEQLDPQPGQRVLEIGAGTGYNAALLAHLVGPEGQVVTLDIDDDLVQAARQHLAAAGCGQVNVVETDGALGYARGQPYDRIILTVASSDIAPAWREQLARPDGRMVLPLAIRGLQRCVVFARGGEGDRLVSTSLRNCSFISMRGLLSMSTPRVPQDADARWVLSSDDERLPLASEDIAELLSRPVRVCRTGLSISLDELRHALHLWLVAREPNLFTLWGGSRLVDLFGFGERAGLRGTLCLLDAAGPSVALLAWCDETVAGGELCVLASDSGLHLAERMQALLREWTELGRPSDAELEISAYPRASGPAPGPGEVAIDQRWSRFILRWLL